MISLDTLTVQFRICQFSFALSQNLNTTWAVVVAQLVERLLPIPEVRGSNPVIGKNLYL